MGRAAILTVTYGDEFIVPLDLAQFAQLNIATCLQGDNLIHTKKATHAEQNCLTGFTLNKKIWWYNNSPPYVTARWLPRLISPFIFFGSIISRSRGEDLERGKSCIICSTYPILLQSRHQPQMLLHDRWVADSI